MILGVCCLSNTQPEDNFSIMRDRVLSGDLPGAVGGAVGDREGEDLDGLEGGGEPGQRVVEGRCELALK
eukprot:3432378-Rhodomonas_salina.2